MLKLKNIRKLLGDEVYPLWLENTLEYGSDLLDLENKKWGVLRASPRRFVGETFRWAKTPQGYGFWRNVDDNLSSDIYSFMDNLPWMFYRRPYTELPRAEYKKSWYFRKDQGRTCIAYLMHDNSMRIHAGCFKGTLQEFEERAFEIYGNDTSENYAKHIAWLKDLQSNNSNI